VQPGPWVALNAHTLQPLVSRKRLRPARPRHQSFAFRRQSMKGGAVSGNRPTEAAARVGMRLGHVPRPARKRPCFRGASPSASGEVDTSGSSAWQPTQRQDLSSSPPSSRPFVALTCTTRDEFLTSSRQSDRARLSADEAQRCRFAPRCNNSVPNQAGYPPRLLDPPTRGVGINLKRSETPSEGNPVTAPAWRRYGSAWRASSATPRRPRETSRWCHARVFHMTVNRPKVLSV
jgi:hypothetical protein